jgi:hypothetical protein
VEVESECGRVWEGETRRHRGDRMCVSESVGGRDR